MSHRKYRAETNCLNCGAEVKGKFCPECGQANIETRENFFHLVGHFISDYLHFDNKFFKSLLYLFTKPGFLTRQYWEGKRVRYIQPLRLFFFITVIFVLVTTSFYHRFGDELKSRMIHSDSTFIKYDTTRLAGLNDSTEIYVPSAKDTLTVKEIKESKVKEARMLKKMRSGVDSFFIYLKYVMFFLLPVYALLFKLLYIRRKTFYVDQLVYVMHLQSFAFCVLMILLFLPFIFPESLTILQRIVMVAIFVYVGLSFRYLYMQPWWKTILKSLIATFLLFFVTIITMVIFAGVDAMYFQ